jgi:hypothetical protein
MKLGIMQPYIFPYIGYFQLIKAVDRFVVYDDVAFIKQGWINRNRILLNGEPHTFTVPLKNASSFVTIGNTGINQDIYLIWCSKFLKTITQAYSKAPYYNEIFELISLVLFEPSDTISNLATNSLIKTCEYLKITTEFVRSAKHYLNSDLKAEVRVIDICKKEKADIYINPIGGKELYDKADFKQAGLDLFFLRTSNITYGQRAFKFVPWLSIIDVMMYNAPETITGFLNDFELE